MENCGRKTVGWLGSATRSPIELRSLPYREEPLAARNRGKYSEGAERGRAKMKQIGQMKERQNWGRRMGEGVEGWDRE